MDVPRYDRVNLVADPVHGYISITKRPRGASSAAEQDLLDDPWLQRLRRIHQLQSAWWVFPSAEHSRFQHALGAMHLAGEWARQIDADLRRVAPDAPSPACVEETLRIAGLLHDVGHGPFGHFFDQNYLDRFGLDHEALGRALILGPLQGTIAAQGASPHGAFEPGERIDPRWVAELIAADSLQGVPTPRWIRLVKPILNGVYTADNLDYVPRDAYMCGIKAGPVDLQRLLHYSFLDESGMVLHQHAAQALLMFLNARLYLYNNIYFHRTVRRIDLHMREIFRDTIDEILGSSPLADLPAYRALTDWSLIETVERWQHAAGRRGELATEWARIVHRDLKWHLVYEDTLELPDTTSDFLVLDPAAYRTQILQSLPTASRHVVIEVDLASIDPRPQNPLRDRFGVRIYNPIGRAIEESAVAKLFRRLPSHSTLVRVFTEDAENAEALRHAVEHVFEPAMTTSRALTAGER